MAADALVPCVIRAYVTMALYMQDEEFQESSVEKMIEQQHSHGFIAIFCTKPLPGSID